MTLVIDASGTVWGSLDHLEVLGTGSLEDMALHMTLKTQSFQNGACGAPLYPATLSSVL